MTTFKCFWKILYQYKIGVLLYLGIFFLMIITQVELGNSNEQMSNPSSIRMSVIDHDQSLISQNITSYFSEIHELIELEDDLGAIQDALFFQESTYILIIPIGFGEQFAANSEAAKLEHIHVLDPTLGIYINQQVDNYLITLRSYLTAGINLETALANVHQDLTQEVIVEFLVSNNTGNTDGGYYFQFLPYALVSAIILAICPIMMTFKGEELEKRLACCATSVQKINQQIMIACLVCAIFIWLLFIIPAYLIFGNYLWSYIGSLIIFNSFIFLIVCVAIAFLIGQITKNKVILYGVANIIGLGMSFLAGVFVPQQFLGSQVLTIARFIPGYWYIRSNDMLAEVILVESVDFPLYLQGIGIQIGFAITLFAVALVVGREKKIQATA